MAGKKSEVRSTVINVKPLALPGILVDMANAFGLPPTYEFSVWGKLISKKNGYMPVKRGMIKTQKIRNAEDMVALQIPQEMRGLKLENPHIMIELHMPKKSWRSDQDNGYTFLQDCLVKSGVLADDSINHCNGFKIMVPVVEADDYYCKVRLWKNEN